MAEVKKEKNLKQVYDDKRALREFSEQPDGLTHVDSINDIRLNKEANELYARLMDGVPSHEHDTALIAFIGGQYLADDPKYLQYPTLGLYIVKTGPYSKMVEYFDFVRYHGCAIGATNRWPTRIGLVPMCKWLDFPLVCNNKTVVFSGDDALDRVANEEFNKDRLEDEALRQITVAAREKEFETLKNQKI